MRLVLLLLLLLCLVVKMCESFCVVFSRRMRAISRGSGDLDESLALAGVNRYWPADSDDGGRLMGWRREGVEEEEETVLYSKQRG